MEQARSWWVLGLLAAAGLLAYSNTFQNQFLLDDEILLQRNALLGSWSNFFRIFTLSSTGGAGGTDSFYRPIQTVFYLLFNQLFGFSLLTFHSLSLVLHILNSFLIHRLGIRLGFHAIGSLAAALLWVLHPIHTESVAYMSGTADSLHTLFCLLGLIYLLPEVSARKIWFSIPLFVLALLSKEPGIVFPALVFVVIYFKAEKPFDWRTYGKTWPLWAVAGLYLLARRTILNFDDTFSFYQTSNVYTESFLYRLYTFFATIPAYLELILWPQDLHLERSFPVYASWAPQAVLGAALVAIFIFLAFTERKTVPRLASFGGLWALAAHVPQSGVLIPVNSLFLEHWMYLVSVGPTLAVFELVFSRVKSKAPLIVLGAGIGVVALALGISTWKQNQRWKDPIIFFEYVLSVEKSPPVRVYNNLAKAYSDQRQPGPAEKYYRKAIDASDSYPQTRHNLASLLVQRGEIDEAISHLERAVEIDPRFYPSYKALSDLYARLQDEDKAEHYRRKYVESREPFLR